MNLLTIDIGNTLITFGMFKGEKLVKVFRINTDANARNLKAWLKKNTGRRADKVDYIIICSVVPKKTVALQQLLKQLFKIKAKVAGKYIRIPIRNLYKKPQQVGKDRLVNAYACKRLYGAPAVIVDFGTATTFDYINKKGQYAGGIIAPGIEISLDALFKKTALLPKVKMKAPGAFLGKSTVDSIRSGARYGLSYMCDALIQDFKRRYAKDLKVIATGGLAVFFKKRCKHIDIVDKNLTLKGLKLLYGKN
ncbi:MAG: type III pantothenate kinase [Candidatus Omnitrophota bacterium]|nr:MAG: type III pantothenate kinase [Candidatus Omnitrophota bacterium]